MIENKYLQINRIVFLALSILLWISCVQDDGGSTTSKRFSIEEARSAFSESYSGALTKSSNAIWSKLSPGDYIPQWDNYTYSETPSVAIFSIPIIGQKEIYAYIPGMLSGRLVVERVRLRQHLEIVRNISGVTKSFLVTIIPSSKGHEGRVIKVYSDVYSMSIWHVECYLNDVCIERSYKLAALRILSGIRLSRVTRITTKSSGEYPYEDDTEEDNDDSFDWSGWELVSGTGDIFTDGNGNYMWDSDGNGIPDTPTIAPGRCEDEGDDDIFPPIPDPDPDSDPDPDPDPDPDYNDPYNPDDGGDNYTEEELIELGESAIEKMQSDIASNQVVWRQYLAPFTIGFGVPLDLHSILYSAASAIRESSANQVFCKKMGIGLSGASTVLSACSTIIIYCEGEEITTAEWISLTASIVGFIGSFIQFSTPIGIGISVTTGIVGLIASLCTSSLEPGEYELILESGKHIRIIIC